MSTTKIYNQENLPLCTTGWPDYHNHNKSVKVNEDAKVVAQIVLNKFASRRFGVTNAGNTEGLVIMVRLQTLLSKIDKK